MESYGFIGEPCEDFILYLGILLKTLEKTVLIYYGTPNCSLWNLNDGKIEDPVNYYGIDFTRNISLLHKMQPDYDIVLGNYRFDELSSGKKHKIGHVINKIFGVADMQANHSNQLKILLDSQINVDFIVIRDLFKGSSDWQYLKTFFEIEVHNVTDQITIPFDLWDYEKRIRTAYTHIRNLRGLSKEYKGALIWTVQKITSLPAGRIKEAYRRCERRIGY